MRELDVKLGFACNNNCVFCLNRDKRHHQVFPLRDIIAQIEVSARRGCRKLIVSGGEPLISPNFFTVLRCAKDAGIVQVEIQTNARMLCYGKFLEKILHMRFSGCGFLVSLHFPDTSLYERYCRTDGFEQVLAGIRNVVKKKMPVTVNTVLMKPNLDLLDDIVSLVRSLGVTRQQFRMIDGGNVRDRFFDFVPTLRQASEAVKKLVRRHGRTMTLTARELPACLLGEKLARATAPPSNPERENLSLGNMIFTEEQIKGQQFSFAEGCAACLCRDVCTGVRNVYKEFYGLAECAPIRESKDEKKKRSG